MRRLLLISPLFLTILGCRHAQSTLYGSGPAADRIANLSWLMVFLFLAITAMMWGLIALAAILRKGNLEEHAPIDVGGGQGWIAIGGVAFPFVVLCVLFILGLNLLKKFPIHDSAKADLKPQILVVGHQWWWEVHYLNDNPSLQVTTANEIHIPSNQPVTIELESRDVIHSFWVPALHGKVDLIPGHPNFIRIEASHPGSYAGVRRVLWGPARPYASSRHCSAAGSVPGMAQATAAAGGGTHHSRCDCGREGFFEWPMHDVSYHPRYLGRRNCRARPDAHWQSAHDRCEFLPERRRISGSVGHARAVSQARCPNAGSRRI